MSASLTFQPESSGTGLRFPKKDEPGIATYGDYSTGTSGP